MESSYQDLINLLVQGYGLNGEQIQAGVEALTEDQVNTAIEWVWLSTQMGKNLPISSAPSYILQWVTPAQTPEPVLSFLQSDISYGTF